jgi:hypothetical protein
VKTAFLHGDLQEEIHMIIPENMSYDSRHFLPLPKATYELVQSTREFCKD